MKSEVIKYRRLIGRIILLSYLFIFTLNILHFHNIHLSNIAKIEQESSANSDSNIRFSEYGCIVQLNFASIHTSITPNLLSSLALNDDSSLSIFENPFAEVYSIHLSSNNLRAPPILS
jgi:hypothetical protein